MLCLKTKKQANKTWATYTHVRRSAITYSYRYTQQYHCATVYTLPPIVQQVVVGVLRARGPLFSRPGHKSAHAFVLQELLRGSEALRKRRGVVRAVHGAVARSTDVDRAIQDRVRVALLAVTLVSAPAFATCEHHIHEQFGYTTHISPRDHG